MGILRLISGPFFQLLLIMSKACIGATPLRITITPLRCVPITPVTLGKFSVKEPWLSKPVRDLSYRLLCEGPGKEKSLNHVDIE